MIYGTGVPSDGLGQDGDHYIDKGSWQVYFDKGSGGTPGSWSGITPEPWIPAPNECRLYSNSGIDLNTSGGLPVPWTSTGFKDAGIVHDTVTNNTRLAPASGRSGRYKVRVRLNYKSAGTIRINLKLLLAKNGTELTGEGESIDGYSRLSVQEGSSATFEWTGFLNDTDYIEIISKQGDVAGTANLIGSGSYIEFEQVSGLALQNGVDATGVSFDNTGTSYTSSNVDGVLRELDGASGFDAGTWQNATNPQSIFCNAQSKKDETGLVHVVGRLGGTGATVTHNYALNETLFTLNHGPDHDIYRTVQLWYGGSTFSTMTIKIATTGVVSRTGQGLTTITLGYTGTTEYVGYFDFHFKES